MGWVQISFGVRIFLDRLPTLLVDTDNRLGTAEPSQLHELINAKCIFCEQCLINVDRLLLPEGIRKIIKIANLIQFTSKTSSI